jgi:hypothetical protein
MSSSKDLTPSAKPPAVDRASESIVGEAGPPRPSAISSGEIEIGPASFGPDSLAGTADSSVAPQSRSYVDPKEMKREPGLPLKTLVGIGAATLLVLVALALLLFR